MSFYDEILSPVFGSRPDVAKYDPVSLTDEQKKAIQGNIGNFPDITKLGDLFRNFMLQQNEKALPGYGNILKSGAAGTQSLLDRSAQFLTGELPKDVQDKIYRSSAYKSFQGGFGGSQMASGLTARDLGLTSLDLIGRGASMLGQGGNSAQQWSSIAGGNVMNPGASLVSPSMQADVTMQNNLADQAYRQNLYNVEASPDPVAAGISNTIMGLIGMYAGGKGGGAAQAGKTNTYAPNSWFANAGGYR